MKIKEMRKKKIQTNAKPNYKIIKSYRTLMYIPSYIYCISYHTCSHKLTLLLHNFDSYARI